jgi:propane monooxygenase reductase component
VSHRVRFEPVGIEIEVEEDETVLDAAFRQGIALAHGCKEGQCSSCKSLLVEGDATMVRYSTFALPDYEKEEGYALLCRAYPMEDLVVELLHYDEKTLRMTSPIRTYQARVEEIERLTHDISRLAIQLTQPKEMAFRAGQYVDIRIPGATASRSFSMANTPSRMDRLEFIIKIYKGGLFSGYLDEHMRVGDEVELVGPYGKFGLREGAAEAIFIGGGSGMAPLWAMVHDMVEQRNRRKVTFFYGARARRDLFYADELHALGAQLGDFRFIPALSEPLPDDAWEGETGLITDVVDRHVTPEQARNGLEAYLCGPPPMIDAAIVMLQRKGIPESRIYYDKFTQAVT